MRRYFTLTLASLAALLLGLAAFCSSPLGLAAEAQEIASPRPISERPEPFPTPPPHVIVMRSAQGDMRVLYREGWRRWESASNATSSIRMIGPRGHGYSVVISAQGDPMGVMVYRDADRPLEGARTEVTDVALGESCDVWISEPQFEERVYGGPVLTCVTRDGIILWSGRRPPSTDAPRIDVRAIALERRRPSWSEFSFPREALDWAYWSSHISSHDKTTRPAYEVRYGERIIRVRGDTRYEARPNGNISLRGLDFLLHYNAHGSRVDNFSIDLGPQRPYPHPLTGGSEPMDRPPLSISGERCHWHRVDLAVRWGIVGVCVTDDGAQLAESTDFYDPAHRDELEVATYFRRGAPDAALMSPPANLFASWIAALPDSAE